MTKTLEPLPYAYNALEPYIDEQTMKIHHDKHHQAYFDKFIKAVEGSALEHKDIKVILQDLPSVPEAVRGAVRNFGGGHYHHSFFWSILRKNVPPQGEVFEAITKHWGSFDKFKEEFNAKAASLFGSGWTWLVMNRNDHDRLEIVNIGNQDSPISEGKIPVLCLDLWEHAYYLKYQNRRPEYIEAFWNIVHWKQVNIYFLEAQ